MLEKSENYEIVEFAPEQNLTDLKNAIVTEVHAYSQKQWFWNSDSSAVKKLKKLSKRLLICDELKKEELFDLFKLVKQNRQSLLTTIKSRFHSYVVLEKLDIENSLTKEQVYFIVSRLKKQDVAQIMDLLTRLSLKNNDMIALVCFLLESNAPITKHYADALINLFSTLEKVNLLNQEAFSSCIGALNKSNTIDRFYTQALPSLLDDMSRLQLLNVENVVTILETLAQADNDLISQLTPMNSYLPTSEYFKKTHIAMANFRSSLSRCKLRDKAQFYFDRIFQHPTPYFYTDILCWFEDRELATESNINALLTVKNPGALFILEIFAGSMTQEDLDLFIMHQTVFADEDVVTALRYVHPGLFTSNGHTLLQYCESYGDKQAKQRILDFVANKYFEYEIGSDYRQCKEKNYQPAVPYVWQPIDDYLILGVAKGASQAEIKDKFSTLAKSLHPDKNHADPQAGEKFNAVLGAYRRLSALNHQEQDYKPSVSPEFN